MTMKKIKISKVGISKTGNSYCIIIPKDFLDHGDIKLDREYNITIEKSKLED